MPQSREAEETGDREARGPKTPSAPRVPAPRERARRRTRAASAPARPPQPPPPTGEPLIAPGVRARPSPARDAARPGGPRLRSPDAEAYGPEATAHPADSIRPPDHPAPPPPVPPAPPAPAFPPDDGRTPLTTRTVAAAACLVLGVGLLGGAGAGAWLSDDDGGPSGGRGFEGARSAWHEVPVDQLFPRTLDGKAAGPGGADRHWTRVAVAPDSGCARAFDPTLAKALSPVGCNRLLRATYADETTSSVTTVGLLFTKGDEDAMRGLRKRFAVENLGERTDLMPRPYAARGTVAADFGDAQRASWTVRVLSDAPVVVYAVTGFADGRVVTDPQAAADATAKGETSAPAQAGLGHDAQGIADRVERGLRRSAVDGDGQAGENRKSAKDAKDAKNAKGEQNAENEDKGNDR